MRLSDRYRPVAAVALWEKLSFNEELTGSRVPKALRAPNDERRALLGCSVEHRVRQGHGGLTYLFIESRQ